MNSFNLTTKDKLGIERAEAHTPPKPKVAVREHALAHQLLDNLHGIEIGRSAHNSFNLPNCINVDNTSSMETVFKLKEIELCGEAAPVDVVSEGDDLPFEDSSYDYVISSHVFEHFPDAIKALREHWRVVKSGGFIFIIIPLRDSLPEDRGKPLTEIDHFINDYITGATNETHESCEGGHYHIWSYESFQSFVKRFFGKRLEWVTGEPIDSKMCNGMTFVYKVVKP